MPRMGRTYIADATVLWKLAASHLTSIGSGMVPLNSPELDRLAKFLAKYNFRSSVTQLAGLLTVPSLQANTIRIETAVHLAVAHCQGRNKPGRTEIGHWLNRELGNTTIALLEDPVNDVFVTNIETPNGNRRIFEGIWETNDYFLQTVLDLLVGVSPQNELQSLINPVFALLRLSDCVAERVGLQRWHAEHSDPKTKIDVPAANGMAERARAVTFSDSDLASLEIDRNLLEPFILKSHERQILTTETIGKTSLESRPLVDCRGTLVLALPHAVSPAIRRYVLSELLRKDHLPSFARALEDFQARQIMMEGFQELNTDIGPLDIPAPSDERPRLTDWLSKYDTDKYLHVVLLHDRLDLLEKEGLTSFMRYPPRRSRAFDNHLHGVANYCASLPDFGEGTTLLILGGLGRGFGLNFTKLPNRWHSSVIRISDFLNLAKTPDLPVTHYLKFLRQKDHLEDAGVRFMDVEGDFNLYGYWHQSDYQLLPVDLPLGPEALVAIWPDFVLSSRQKARRLVDEHVTQDTEGHHLPVRRFFREEFFRSLEDRPIYVSMPHLQAGVLAGVVETKHGPCWLSVGGSRLHKGGNPFVFEMWRGFLELYDRLAGQLESSGLPMTTAPLEIQLDLSNVQMPDSDSSSQANATSEPQIVVDINRRTAVIEFSPSMLQSFQQPENFGERFVLRSIAQALVRLRNVVDMGCEVKFVEMLIDNVLEKPDIRVLHLLPVHDSVDGLQQSNSPQAIFVAPEDHAFAALGLSEGCIPTPNSTAITEKSDCNRFLRSVVDKVWRQIRDRLRQLDRTSVISKLLNVHEAIGHDRDHWKRTARALIALYATGDDVFAVARDREAKRAVVGLSSRTLLEMAVCECPEVDGRNLSRWELDDLLANTTLMLEAATDSDAIAYDLVEPQIHLHSNGQYTMDRNFYKAVMSPFLAAYNREAFETAAQDYNKLYRSEAFGKRTPVEEVYSMELIEAFQTEYSLPVTAAVEGCSELLDLAVERNSIVVETTLGTIKDRLTSARGLSHEAVEAFVRTFSLTHRRSWEEPPPGFEPKDIYPWRFSRRLSYVTRPLLVFGKQNTDKVLFAVGALRVGIAYLLDKIEQGHFSQDFFKSKHMRRYIGKVNNQKGHAFAQAVSAEMRKTGWSTRVEVQMTELGGPAQLGDLDVLAWKANGEIQVIECKRLQFARTIGEAASVCKRFRGEAKDELAKHVRRTDWIRGNPASLRHVVGFIPDAGGIDHRLVTNVPVPMTYLTSLPIQADKIGPLKSDL